ncbi:hypothetical protein ASD07_25780 [Duganella sp. Root336D2]|nr:hypothetical protein ASD07_25780 [Duganella sp. Root336D2]
MLRTSFDDDADVMARQRADALIANASNWDSIYREPGRTYVDDFATMRGRVVKANDVRHA